MKDYAVLTNDGKYTIYEMRDTDINYATHYIYYKYNQQIHQFIAYNFYRL